MGVRFTPIGAGARLEEVIATLNRNLGKFDRESITKTINGPDNTTAVLLGLRTDGTFGLDFNDRNGNKLVSIGQFGFGYGILLYENGIPCILLGSAPDDGRMGFWSASKGKNVLELLGLEESP